MARSGSRTQPWETGRPIENGSLVPWMPTGPPSRHDLSTSENAEMPSALAPYGPCGFVRTNRCVM